jgi:hypothetical protein
VASIASLKVTVIGAVADTTVAPFAGEVDITVGGASSRVVNDQIPGEPGVGTNAFPARSFTPLVMVAVMLAELGNGLVGMNSAMRVAGA